MANISVTNVFSAGTVIKAAEANQNFTDIISGTSDGSKDLSISALTAGGIITFSGLTASRGVWTNASTQLTSSGPDNAKIVLGSGGDAEIYYDGTDLNIDPDAVGSGVLKVGANISTNGNESFNYDEGSFTISYYGFATDPQTATAYYVVIGKMVILMLPLVSDTSNVTTFNAQDLPAAIRPVGATQVVPVGTFVDNGILTGTNNIEAQITAAGAVSIDFLYNGSKTGWTNSGAKGIALAQSLAYYIGI